MTKSLYMVAALGMMVPSMVLAAPYIGIGIGGTRTESSLRDLGLFPGPVLPLPPAPFPDPNFTGSDDFSSTDVSFDVTVGWMFSKHLGIEAGYIDFGSAEQRYELPESCVPVFGCGSREWTAQMEMTGFRLFAIGNLPINEHVDAFLKLGAMSWEADYSGLERNQAFVSGPPIAPGYEAVNFDGDDTGLAAGLGVNLKTGSPFSVRVELNYYDVDTTDLVWNAGLVGVYTF